MGLKATNTIEQIKLLEKRGMILDESEEKIKEVLLDIGYYRLGFYWHPFEVDSHHNLKEGTRFSDCLDLYYLDVDLRRLLIEYINRIEVNFRTKVVYYVSNANKETATWFIDPNVVTQSYIEDFPNHYSGEFKRSNKPIKKHHQKHLNDKYAPAWKALEFFTFGAILKTYKSLRDKDLQQRISKLYDINDVSKFINFMSKIVLLRNVGAHGGVLFDFQLPTGISKIPQIDFHKGNRTSLGSSIKVISFILGSISKSRQADFVERIDKTIRKHQDRPVIREIIESKMGYEL